jgi:hypothetical protein
MERPYDFCTGGAFYSEETLRPFRGEVNSPHGTSESAPCEWQESPYLPSAFCLRTSAFSLTPNP